MANCIFELRSVKLSRLKWRRLAVAYFKHNMIIFDEIYNE